MTRCFANAFFAQRLSRMNRFQAEDALERWESELDEKDRTEGLKEGDKKEEHQ